MNLLNEIVLDFYDRLKSVSRGYASFDWLIDYRLGDLSKLDILLNGDVVDALSLIVPKEQAYYRGRELCKQFKKLLPSRCMNCIQAAIGSKIIARETGLCVRWTASVTEGTLQGKAVGETEGRKEKEKRLGTVEVPQEAFMAVLKIDNGGSSS